jgi:DNA-binding transcriptional LysR family regulator
MRPLDLTRFDLNLLVVLEALWAERHVGRAAERLHLSQSATSHALSRLRTAFDDQLFIRNPRGVVPTPLTVELMPRVAAVLESVRLVASPRGPFDPGRLQATLSVAATDHAVLTVIAPALAKIQAAAPDAVLKLRPADSESALRMLDAGELDIVLGSGSFAEIPQRFDCQLVHKERFIGIARKGHPALIKRGKKLHMDLDDFARLPGLAARRHAGRSRRCAGEPRPYPQGERHLPQLSGGSVHGRRLTIDCRGCRAHRIANAGDRAAEPF